MSVFQVKERAENLGSAFLHKGHSKINCPHIGIFSQNRPEVSSPLSVSIEMSQQAPGSSMVPVPVGLIWMVGLQKA